jgi:hypothetical protein
MPMTGGIVLRAATQDDLAAMAEISVEARSRYRTMSSFAYVAETPAIAECRFLESCAIVAVTPAQTVLGFALSRPLDGYCCWIISPRHPGAGARVLARDCLMRF